MSADGDDMESIPAIPPDWSDLTDSQVGKFAESLGYAISAGVFPAAFAEELAAYRNKASEELRIRMARAKERGAAAGSGLPFRPVPVNGGESVLWMTRLSRSGRGAAGRQSG